MSLLDAVALLRRRSRHHFALRRARSVVARSEGPDVLASASWLFDELGVTLADARAVETETLSACGHEERPEGSLHYLWFAALQAAGFRPASILELGTFRAEATEYLATLWPDATVYTVDLPPDDPIVGPAGLSGYRDARRAERLAKPNIIAIDANTMSLPALDLPRPDLVWLDAGHEFPEVAWDHQHCLHALNVGGWLLTDDVRTTDNTMHRDRPAFYDVWTVVRYWNERQVDRFRLLPKRDDQVLAIADPKHIGILRKTVPIARGGQVPHPGLE